METVLETIPSAVVIIDASSGKFSYVNKRAMQLYGFDTLGLGLDENVAKVKARRADGTDYPIEEMPVSRSLKFGQEVRNAEMIIERPDGQVLPIIASTAPLRDMQGNISAAIVVFEDITERKKTEASFKEVKDQLELQIKRMPIGCIVWDKDFKVTSWNPAAETIFVYSAKEAIGKHPYDIIVPKEAQPIVEKIWRRLLEGDEIANNINDNLTKEGKLITCSWSNTPLKREDNSVIGVLSMVQESTERKEAEEKLEEYRNSLEKLVEERTTQLKDSERLATIGATAGMVGHDIRNPLQAIIGDVYLAKTEIASIPDSDEKKSTLESLEGIEKNIEYINKIVADLQDFARPLHPHSELADLKLIIEDLLKRMVCQRILK